MRKELGMSLLSVLVLIVMLICIAVSPVVFMQLDYSTSVTVILWIVSLQVGGTIGITAIWVGWMFWLWSDK